MSIDPTWLQGKFPDLNGLSRVGRGGQKWVFGGTHSADGDVVLKLFHPLTNPERAQREVQAAQEVCCPRVPRVFEVGNLTSPLGQMVWVREQRIRGEDFRSTGIAFINLAWDSIISVSLNLSEAPVENWGGENDAETIASWKAALDGYLQSAQQELATAVALAQQGTEFLLKSKIAGVSPFLLISGSPGEWPKGCDKTDTPFADFKTIDAQDLPRAHDSVCSPRLSDEFKAKFDQLRRLRNTVMHTVDRRARFTIQDGVLAVLEVIEALIAPQGWVAVRRTYLQEAPALVPDGENAWGCLLAREMTCVTGLLQPAQMLRFFGFDKRQRRYLCPNCDLACADWQIGADLAVLSPNTPESTTVHCFVCAETYQVERRDCGREGCPGNVFSADWDSCLTCGR